MSRKLRGGIKVDIIHMISVFGLCFIAVTLGEYLEWLKMFKKGRAEVIASNKKRLLPPKV